MRVVSAAFLLILFVSFCTYLSAKDVEPSSSVQEAEKFAAAETEVKKAKIALEKAKEALSAEKKSWRKKELAGEAKKASAIEKEVKEAKIALRKAIDSLDAKEKDRKKTEKINRSKKISAAKAEIKKAKIALKKANKALSVQKKAKKKREKLEQKKKKIQRALAIKTKGKKNVIAEEKAKKKIAKLEEKERALKEQEANKKAKQEEKARKKKEKEEKKAQKKEKKKKEKEAKEKAGLTTQQKIDKFGKQIDEVRKQMPQEMLEEQKIKVEPEAKANILSGAFSIMVKQRIKKSFLEFGGEYDFADSFMGFNLDYNYKIGIFYTGFAVKDTIDFNEVFSNSKYLQRVQSITPYTRPRLHKRLFAKLSLTFEDTNTTSLETGTTIDSGKNIVGQLRFDHYLMNRQKKTPSGIEQSLSFMNSYENLGSDYAYALGEYSFLGVLRVFGDKYFEYKLDSGVPLNSDNKPLSALYWAGGYKILRGYDFKEFVGGARLYQRVSYNVPLTEVKYDEVIGIKYSVVTWNLAFEAVEIGNREDVYYVNDTLKLSAEVGLAYKLILLKYLPLKLEFIVAKAMEARPPKAYLLLSTVFYSWSNE